MKNHAGAWAGAFFAVFGIVVFVQSFSYKYSSNMGPGPGMFPLWLSGILIVLSVLSIVNSIKKERIRFADILPKGKDLQKLIVILAALAGYILLIPYTGFIITGALFLFVLLWREYRWFVNLGISIGVSALLFWVFDTLLSVPLPVNDLGF